MSAKILIIDDEVDIRTLIKYTLEKEGYEVDEAEDGIQGLKKIKETHPDLVILDVMMPGMDGIEMCNQLRQDLKYDDVFVCFLTARSEDYSQIAGFESGGDDYIAKPVKPRVLASRIKSILKRRSKKNEQANVFKVDDIVIDREKYLVYIDGEEMVLPRKEFELLNLLVTKNGNVCKREDILDQVWGEGVIVGDRTIDVHVRKLREKIGDNRIKTVKGVGYKFVV